MFPYNRRIRTEKVLKSKLKNSQRNGLHQIVPNIKAIEPKIREMKPKTFRIFLRTASGLKIPSDFSKERLISFAIPTGQPGYILYSEDFTNFVIFFENYVPSKEETEISHAIAEAYIKR